jgi:hypothetical protein
LVSGGDAVADRNLVIPAIDSGESYVSESSERESTGRK